MVVFENSIGIEALEPEVVELYRCASAVSLTVEGRPGPDAQAVACAIRRDGRFLVYVGLYVKSLKRTLVYAVDPVPGGRPEFVEALQKARDFAQAMGFQMEPVGLRFSSAMREVILRQIPVLFPPMEAQKMLLDRTAEIEELERLAAELDEEESPDADPGVILTPDQLTEQQHAKETRATAAKNAARKLAIEKRLDEQAEALRQSVGHYLEEINAPEAAIADSTEREELRGQLATAQARAADLQASLQTLEKQLRAGQMEREKLAREKAAADQQMAELQQGMQQAKQQANAAAAAEKSRQELESLLQREKEKRAALQQEKQTAEQTIDALEKKLGQARQETEAAARQQKEVTAAGDKQLKGLQKQLQQAREELEASQAEGQHLQELKAAAETRAAELTQTLQEAGKAATTKEVATATGQEKIVELEKALRLAKAEAETERQQRQTVEKARRQDEARLKELERALQQAKSATPVTIEVATADSGHQAEVAALAEEVAERTKEVAELTKEVAERTKEVAELVEAAEAERKARRQLEKSGQQYEARLAELQEALRQATTGEGVAEASSADPEEVTALRESLRQSEERVEFLRHEVERFAAAKAIAEQRLADSRPVTGQAEVAAVAKPPERKNTGLGALILAKADSGPPPHVLRRPPPPGAFFHVDWDRTSVPCPTVGDLCEVHQSIGMAQLSMEGYPNQYCSAFIVVVKAGDQKHLFMPFRLCTSNRVLVYVPAEQPANPASLTKALKEASRFLQVVGMETERVSLSRKGGKLPAELEAILALDDSPRNAGNF